MRHPRGFTLVELLVVIAIIAILAAILIPTLLAARERAQSTKCMGNMRNLAIALNEYSDINRGRYPGYAEAAVPGLVWSNGRSDDGIWASRIDGFLGGATEIWTCPAVPEIGASFRTELSSADTGIPYGINNHLSMRRDTDGKIIGRPTSMVKSPRTTVLLAECDTYDAGGDLSNPPDLLGRHGDGGRFFNIVFCDSNAQMVDKTVYPDDWDLGPAPQ